jgi:hypothetical protein
MNTIVQLTYEELHAVVKNSVREAMAEMNSATAQPAKQDRIDFKDALAHFQACGVPMSESKLRKLCMQQAVPSIGKFGRRIVFSRQQLDQWIQANTVKPIDASAVMTERLRKAAKP